MEEAVVEQELAGAVVVDDSVGDEGVVGEGEAGTVRLFDFLAGGGT